MGISTHMKQARVDARERELISPDILSDHQVVFRLYAPRGKQVAIVGQFLDEAMPLDRNKEGVWSITVGPIPPGIYQYSFVVDSMSMIDPGNRDVKPVNNPHMSILNISGNPPLLHDFQDVPHGTLHRHWYRSASLGAVRSIEVYTPPEYEIATGNHPTLYLLPGSNDTETIWSIYGKVHWILDNLIAQKSAVPMVVAMVDGQAGTRKALQVMGVSNTEALRLDLVNNVVPLVESTYRTVRESGSRAIFGVSRGGGQSLIIGLIHSETFGWIGGMSSAVVEPKTTIDLALSEPVKVNGLVRFLWFGCGDEEGVLLRMNQKFSQSLSRVGIRHEFSKTHGSCRQRFHGRCT
jgi:enterochelin esterase family protein